MGSPRILKDFFFSYFSCFLLPEFSRRLPRWPKINKNLRNDLWDEHFLPTRDYGFKNTIHNVRRVIVSWYKGNARQACSEWGHKNERMVMWARGKKREGKKYITYTLHLRNSGQPIPSVGTKPEDFTRPQKWKEERMLARKEHFNGDLPWGDHDIMARLLTRDQPLFIFHYLSTRNHALQNYDWHGEGNIPSYTPHRPREISFPTIVSRKCEGESSLTSLLVKMAGWEIGPFESTLSLGPFTLCNSQLGQPSNWTDWDWRKAQTQYCSMKEKWQSGRKCEGGSALKCDKEGSFGAIQSIE